MNKHYIRPWDYPEEREPPRRGFVERGGLLLVLMVVIAWLFVVAGVLRV